MRTPKTTFLAASPSGWTKHQHDLDTVKIISFFKKACYHYYAQDLKSGVLCDAGFVGKKAECFKLVDLLISSSNSCKHNQTQQE